MHDNNVEEANKADCAVEGIMRRKNNEFEVERRVYHKLCDFEREAFVDNMLQPDLKGTTEEVSRRRKKLGASSHAYARIVMQEEIDQDIARVKQITGVYSTRARIENKMLKVRGGSFKKNDQVKVRFSSVIESVSINSINTTEVVFRRRDGTKFKCTVADISDNAIKIYKLRKSNTA